jgi:hypothetical protein
MSIYNSSNQEVFIGWNSSGKFHEQGLSITGVWGEESEKSEKQARS